MVADLAIIFTASLLMVVWNWGTWPDPLIDWGTHLYVAWQVSAGKVLYRDLAYFNGPLSVHFSALLFYLFGVQQHVLWYANLAILAVIIVMLYVIMRHIGHRVSATASALIFVTLFAFPRITLVGNYNYVTPYTQEMTHGVVCSLAGLCCLVRYLRTRSIAAAAVAGLTVGFLFLTKAELFPGGFGAVTVGFAAAMWATRSDRGHVAAIAGVFSAAALLPPLIAVGLLSTKMPLAMAITGTLGSWPWLLDPRISSIKFYRWVAGLDDVPGNLSMMLRWLGGYLLVFASLALGASLAGRTLPRSSLMPIALGTASIAALVASSVHVQWIEVGRPLTAVAVSAVALLVPVWQDARHKRQSSARPDLDRHVLWSALVLLGTGYLAKIGLMPRIWHYGFVLAMPTAMILIDALLHWIPEWLDRRRASGLMFQVVTIGIMTGVVTSLLYDNAGLSYVAGNVVKIGQNGDSFWADGVRGPDVRASLGSIRSLVSQYQTLAVVPQGPMINYLARRRNPTRFLNLMPPEILSAGEDSVLAEYRAHPPDFILLVHSQLTPHGMQFEGEEYARKLFAWIVLNYQPVVRDFGSSPPPGLMLMRYVPNNQGP